MVVLRVPRQRHTMPLTFAFCFSRRLFSLLFLFKMQKREKRHFECYFWHGTEEWRRPTSRHFSFMKAKRKWKKKPTIECVTYTFIGPSIILLHCTTQATPINTRVFNFSHLMIAMFFRSMTLREHLSNCLTVNFTRIWINRKIRVSFLHSLLSLWCVINEFFCLHWILTKRFMCFFAHTFNIHNYISCWQQAVSHGLCVAVSQVAGIDVNNDRY